MHHPGRVLALLALLAAAGCVKLDSYQCAQSSECQNGGEPGTCEPEGVCSFPDDECSSGKKYGALAGAQSGQCVGMVSDTGDQPTVSPTGPDPGTTTSTSTTFDPGTSTTFEPTTLVTSEVTVTTTTDSTQTSDPGTTGPGPTCGEIGELCVDGVCCGGCAVCDGDNRCNPAPADQAMEKCGICSFCGGDGECALAAVDSPCPADCGDIVWKEVVALPLTTCYAYGDQPTTGSCNGEGTCLLPDPIVAKCPEPELDKATKLAECEVICSEEKDPCIPGGPAVAVTMDAYCFLASPTPACTTTCSDDLSFLNPASCDGGICVHTAPTQCGPFVCDPAVLMCLTECVDDTQCAMGTTCQNSVCM